MLFRTEYLTAQGHRMTTQCYAEDETHLQEVIKLRGMGERLVYAGGRPPAKPEMPSSLIAQRKFAAAMHALTWVSMIAVKARPEAAWEILSDDGVMHEMAHFLEESSRYGLGGLYQTMSYANGLMRRVQQFEQSVPGVHPKWGGASTEDEERKAREAEQRRRDQLDAYAYAMQTMAASPPSLKEAAERLLGTRADMVIIDEAIDDVQNAKRTLFPERQMYPPLHGTVTGRIAHTHANPCMEIPLTETRRHRRITERVQQVRETSTATALEAVLAGDAPKAYEGIIFRDPAMDALRKKLLTPDVIKTKPYVGVDLGVKGGFVIAEVEQSKSRLHRKGKEPVITYYDIETIGLHPAQMVTKAPDKIEVTGTAEVTFEAPDLYTRIVESQRRLTERLLDEAYTYVG